MSGLKKRASKRVSLKQKYKVDRKIKEHKKKVRKEEREKGPQKGKKDPGIPNLWPFKEDMLRQAEKRKERLEEEKQRQKLARQQEMQNKRMEKGPKAGTTEELVKRAEEQMKSFVASQNSKVTTDISHMSAKEKTERKTFMREVKKVVEIADVLLEVLDARDPIGCRCPSLEESILNSGQKKKIILVLNKIDLVPPEVVEKWLKYFRRELPTVAFKCSTQTQRKNLGHKSLSSKAAQTSTSDCLGADALMSLLKNYARSGDIKTSVVVGVFGFPNTGKSSLINSLMRSKAVGVGATPGFTKVTSEVHLDKNIKLLDCPGVVFAKGGENDPNVILRNCVKIEQIQDPFSPVELIVKRCGKEQLRKIYSIEAYTDVTHFLALVARKIGKLKKRGVPDTEAAAKSVIKDWTSGKISYYTTPPKSPSSILSSTVVSNFSKELDLDELLKEHDSNMFTTLQNTVKNTNFMEVNPGEAITDVDFDHAVDNDEAPDDTHEQEEEEEEEEEETNFVVDEMEADNSQQTDKKKGQTTQKVAEDPEDLFNPQTNKSLKKKLKSLKKKKSQPAPSITTSTTAAAATKTSKAAPKANKGSGAQAKTSSSNTRPDQPYNFAEDFVDDQEIADVDV